MTAPTAPPPSSATSPRPRGRHRTAILGGGLAGLTAARELARRGEEFVLFEASANVAGLASTERDEEGFTYDIGAHFITNRLAGAIGVGAQCRTVEHYGEVVHLADRDRLYPMGLLAVPRYVASAARQRLRGGAREPVSAADWFRREYGPALADEIALPLLEQWSGAPADRLSAAVGDKLPGGLVETVMLRAMGRLSHRAVAIGYGREKPQSPWVFHVYPEDGVSTVSEALASEVRSSLRLSTPVEKVFVEGDQVVGVRAGGEQHEVDGVISTAPVNVLPRLVEGTSVLDRFGALRYRPMVLVNLKLLGRGLLSDTVVWFPDDRPFFRATEATLSMPWLAPEGKTTVLCDIGAEVGDVHWEMSDEDLARLCLANLADVIPDAEARYLGCRVIRTKLSYPVFLLEYEETRRALEQEGTGVPGLLSVGRNGAFRHDLMEDVYWRTTGLVGRWCETRDAAAAMGGAGSTGTAA